MEKFCLQFASKHPRHNNVTRRRETEDSSRLKLLSQQKPDRPNVQLWNRGTSRLVVDANCRRRFEARFGHTLKVVGEVAGITGSCSQRLCRTITSTIHVQLIIYFAATVFLYRKDNQLYGLCDAFRVTKIACHNLIIKIDRM